VGWCGIQQEGGEYEIALVLDDRYWGLGRKIFRELMSWATELGHQTVYVHFLHTRPEYKFLRKIANSVYENEIMGNKFTTYRLSVN
jgi:GNAT superfamily N-acetyltransferase